MTDLQEIGNNAIVYIPVCPKLLLKIMENHGFRGCSCWIPMIPCHAHLADEVMGDKVPLTQMKVFEHPQRMSDLEFK